MKGEQKYIYFILLALLMLETAADAVSVQGGIYQAEANPKQRDTDQKKKCLLEKHFQKTH